MSAKDTGEIVLVGIGVYLLWQVLSAGQKLVQPAANAVGSVVADFYTWAVLQRQSMNLLGNVILPDGTLAPLQGFDVRQSPDDQVYANYQGHFYQLYPADDNGNWPSVLVQ
jgi:hypothetical protein